MPIFEVPGENSGIDAVARVHLKIFHFYNGRIRLFQYKAHG